MLAFSSCLFGQAKKRIDTIAVIQPVQIIKVLGLDANGLTKPTNTADLKANFISGLATQSSVNGAVNTLQSQINDLGNNKSNNGHTHSYTSLTNVPLFSTVATSGSYNDLTNKPVIPAAQVQSDWSATSGLGSILNKPDLSQYATTTWVSDSFMYKSDIRGNYVSTNMLIGTRNNYPLFLMTNNTIAARFYPGSYNEFISAQVNQLTTTDGNYSALQLKQRDGAIYTYAQLRPQTSFYNPVPSIPADKNVWVFGHDGTLGVQMNTLSGGAKKRFIDSVELAQAISAKVSSGDLAPVATSGSYADLSNKPTISKSATISYANNSSSVTFDFQNADQFNLVAASTSAVFSNLPVIPVTISNAKDGGQYEVILNGSSITYLNFPSNVLRADGSPVGQYNFDAGAVILKFAVVGSNLYMKD
jgi:hypothetical protein